MSQAGSDAHASSALADDADHADTARGGSWWRTLPGMFTAAATLISAITGLVVAIQQLRPTSNHQPTPTPAETSAATLPSAQTRASGASRRSVRVGRVSFPAGRRVEINGLRYDILTATTSVSNPGERTLTLRVKMTNPGAYDANFWNQTFRLRVGSDIRAPTSFLDDLVHGGTTDTGEIDFTLASSIRNATLLVGDEPSKAIALPIRFGGGT